MTTGLPVTPRWSGRGRPPRSLYAPPLMEIPAPRLWQEPVRGWYVDPEDALRLTGLELLTPYETGERLPPPIHYLTGMTFRSAAPGTSTFTMPASEWLLAPQGVIGGAALSLLVDGPLGCAVQTALPAATPYTTAEMSLSYVRRVDASSGMLTAVATLVHAGRSVGLAEARISDGAGQLVATASTRCAVLPRMDAGAAGAPVPVRPPVVEPRWDTPHPFQREIDQNMLAPAAVSAMSGLEALRACIGGALPAPPIAHLCGIAPQEADEGRSVWTMPASEWLCSPVRGRLFGGAIAYLAGTAVEGTAQTVASTAMSFAPVDLKVYFLRPVTPDGGALVATGEIVSRGRTQVVATSRVVNARGKPVALAIGSALLRR